MSIGQACGLPALLATLLRLGHGVGLAPQKVYSGASPNRHEARDSWQWRLLHDRPSPEVPPSTLFGNLAIQMAGAGYGCVRMYAASRGRVVELMTMDSSKVTPKRQGGRLVFEDRSADGKTPVIRDESEIIYVPSVSLDGGPVGVSPISAYRMGIQVALRRQRFELSHYINGAQGGTLLTGPDKMTPADAQEWVDLWDERHQGEENAFATGFIGGGFTATNMPVSLVDAQFVEATRMTAEQAGSIYAMPKSFLNLSEIAPSELDWRFFTTFCIGPYTNAIAQAFNANRILFPQGSGLMTEHLTDAILKPDIRTRYEAYRAARQAGWMTSNEVRALENIPPHPDGDVLQVIPVGGGANPDTSGKALLDELERMWESSTGHERDLLTKVLERGKDALV
jgi:HK97 family phage portal protein